MLGLHLDLEIGALESFHEHPHPFFVSLCSLLLLVVAMAVTDSFERERREREINNLINKRKGKRELKAQTLSRLSPASYGCWILRLFRYDDVHDFLPHGKLTRHRGCG